MKLTNTQLNVEYDPEYICMARGYWGKGKTIDEAKANCRKAAGSKPKQFIVYAVHPKTTVGGLGDFSYPIGCRPQEIERRGFKKKTA